MRNTTKIKVTGYPKGWDGSIGSPIGEGAKEIQLATILNRLCYLRTARKIGDIETINNTQLGNLRNQSIQFEILN